MTPSNRSDIRVDAVCCGLVTQEGQAKRPRRGPVGRACSLQLSTPRAPARTGDAGGVPASTEHPFELAGLGRYRSPSPAAAKLLARQQGPRHYLLGHHYAASNRAGLGCAVSPCPRPHPRRACSRGGWARRLGGVRVSETATIVKLAIFVYYPRPGCAPRPLQIPSGGIST